MASKIKRKYTRKETVKKPADNVEREMHVYRAGLQHDVMQAVEKLNRAIRIAKGGGVLARFKMNDYDRHLLSAPDIAIGGVEFLTSHSFMEKGE